MTPSPDLTDQANGRDLIGGLLLLVGLYHVAVSLFMIVAPETFFETLGPFDRFSPHYLQDVAAFQLALGIGTLVAVGVRAWRVPVLAILTLTFGLHAVSHLVDMGDTEPAWIGPAEATGLVVATVVLAAVTMRVRRKNRA